MKISRICKKSYLTPILLLISGICYGIAFIFPDSLWWTIFFYPLFFLMAPTTIGFFGAFFWSFIAHCLHLSGIALALYQMNTPLLIIIGMFLYVPLITGCIFAVVKKVSFSMKRQQIHIAPTLINGLSLLLHRLCITCFIMLPFGRLEGYIFMHPLILLVDLPLFQSALRWYNLDILTIIFYTTFTFIMLFFHEKKKAYLALAGICILLIIFPSGFKKKGAPVPAWIHSIAVIPLFFPDPKNLTAISTIIKQKMEDAQRTRDINLFVLPEGAINCPLSCEQIEKMFGTDEMHNILVCSSAFKKQKIRNSCFFLQKNNCRTVYHKRHALPITERPINRFQTIDVHIRPSKNPHPIIFVNEEFSLVPYICSDFFFNNREDDVFHTIPIIVLCNDIWFSGFASYIRQLMVKTTQFKAINWNRPIVYSAYSSSYYININGTLTALFQVK